MLWLAGPAIDMIQASWVLVMCAACMLPCQASTEATPTRSTIAPSFQHNEPLVPASRSLRALRGPIGYKSKHTLHLMPMPACIQR